MSNNFILLIVETCTIIRHHFNITHIAVMNIKLILARLQSALSNDNLVEQMVLFPEPIVSVTDKTKSKKLVDLVVGYNGSSNSQIALDIALWIAHQTRLATQKQVTVHVVYALDENQSNQHSKLFDLVDINCHSTTQNQWESSTMCALKSHTSVLSELTPQALVKSQLMTAVDSFDQADRILWQARCLAEEWKGVFTAHLRFGNVAAELRKVVESEAADLLLLGCRTSKHPVVQKLDANFPCSVLGIPLLC